MRIVICDDHGLMLEALQMAFTDLGHEVVASTVDLEEVVEAVALHQPDVCLLDVSFPSGSSLMTIPRILEVASSTRVVMLSADSSHSVVAQAIALGASGFIRKDKFIGEVVEALNLAVHGHLAVDPAMLQGALKAGQPGNDPLWQLSFLTDREWQVLRCIIDGKSTSEMARTLGVRHSTARTHVQSVLTKLGVHSRLQAAALMAAYATGDTWPAHVR